MPSWNLQEFVKLLWRLVLGWVHEIVLFRRLWHLRVLCRPSTTTTGNLTSNRTTTNLTITLGKLFGVVVVLVLDGELRFRSGGGAISALPLSDLGWIASLLYIVLASTFGNCMPMVDGLGESHCPTALRAEFLVAEVHPPAFTTPTFRMVTRMV